MQASTILVVDDEQPLADLVSGYLRTEGFRVLMATDGHAALEAARQSRPDLVILDVMLPGLDGIEVCRRLQYDRPVCVLMLTARSDEVDKLIGLSVGADDYLTKPFSPRELVARVKAILRRARGERAVPQEPTLLQVGPLQIDPLRRDVRMNGRLIDLTAREFDLLYVLAAQPGRVFRREELLRRIWGPDFAGIDRVVDVHIGMVRRKLLDAAPDADLLVTVRGVGYKFAGHPSS
jgi:two-component system, OmpR family, alkaline phosphatase synthesis response regulator PhoP